MPLHDNVLEMRQGRFTTHESTTRIGINCFNFEKGLKSINDPDTMFINKASSEEEDVFNYLLDLYLLYKEEDYSFLDDFLGDELEENYRTDRLLKIINKVQKSKYKNKDLKYIRKLNNKKYPELHFFVKVSGDNYSIFLIDLYHLGVYGTRYINKKEKPIDIPRLYKSKKENKVDLERILEL